MLTRADLLTGLMASAAAALAGARTYRVVIDKMAFAPAELSVRAGDVVVFENHDIFRHTATSKDGGFNIDLAPGKSGQTVMKKPGAYGFVCTFHPGMKGRIVVTP